LLQLLEHSLHGLEQEVLEEAAIEGALDHLSTDNSAVVGYGSHQAQSVWQHSSLLLAQTVLEETSCMWSHGVTERGQVVLDALLTRPITQTIIHKVI
jgi:hypothetical protein